MLHDPIFGDNDQLTPATSGGSSLYDPVFGDEPAQAAPAASVPPERSWSEAAKDLVMGFGAGANALLETGGTLYGLITGDMDNWARRQGAAGREFYQQRMSPALQARQERRAEAVAAADGEVQKFVTALQETAGDPLLLSNFVAEQIPNLVASGLGGRLAALGVRALGGGATAAGTAATAGAVGTGAVLQGADAGGEAYTDLQQIPVTDAGLDAQDLWTGNEAYRRLTAAGMSPEQARERVALELSRLAALKAAAISAGVNLVIPGARTLDRVLSGSARATGPGGLVGVLRGGVSGFVGEGVSESIDEAGSRIAANQAVQQVNPSHGTFDGVGERAAEGLLFAPLGGISGAFEGGVRPSRRAPSDTQQASGVRAEDVIGTVEPGAAAPAPDADATVAVPAALPPPRIIVNPEGAAGTEAQWERTVRERSEVLGLSPDVEAASSRHPGAAELRLDVSEGAAGDAQASPDVTPPPAPDAGAAPAAQLDLGNLPGQLRELEALIQQVQQPGLRARLVQEREALLAQIAGEKPKLSPAERARRARLVEPAKDDLLTAIRKLGGIDTAIDTDWAGRFKGMGERQIGLPAIERPKKGRSLDDLAEVLHELGYLRSRDKAELEDRLSLAESGQRIYSLWRADDAIEREIEQREAARYQQASSVAWADASDFDDLWAPRTVGVPGARLDEAEYHPGIKEDQGGRLLAELSGLALDLDPNGAEQLVERLAIQDADTEASIDALIRFIREWRAQSVQPDEQRSATAGQSAAAGGAAQGDSLRPGDGAAVEGRTARAALAQGAADDFQLTAPQEVSGARSAPPREEQLDAFGGRTATQQAVHDAMRARDARRNGAADVPMSASPGDLFSGRGRQLDLTDTPPPHAARTAPQETPADAGVSISGDRWTRFSTDSGTLGIPRAEMPQIRAEHRGALVNFLAARGIGHRQETVPAASLKPTQAEFSRRKVEEVKRFEGGARAILVSRDGHVLDGHHQWLAALETGKDVRVIRFNAPIRDLVRIAHEFPSSRTEGTGFAALARDAAPVEADTFDPYDSSARFRRSDLGTLPPTIDVDGVQRNGYDAPSNPDIRFHRDAPTGINSRETPAGMSVEEVSRVAQEYWEEFQAGLRGYRLVVKADAEAAFGADTVTADPSLRRVKGAHYAASRRLLLISAALRDANDVRATIRHEILAHYGLNLFASADKQAILDRISASRRVPGLASVWADIDRLYHDKSESVRAEEVLARLAETIEPDPSWRRWWDEFVEWFANLLRKAGVFRGKVTAAELRNMLRAIAAGIRRGAGQRTFPASDYAQFATYGDRAPIFYSQLRRVLAAKLPASAPAAQMLDAVRAYARKGEFKASELAWSGLEEWLADQEGRVTKAAVLDFIDANRVEVGEVLLEQGAGARYGSYTLPGGENYRELLLTLPAADGQDTFTSGHFDQPNVLAHVRFNERVDADGKRVLFIEEIQSDWHQQGRRKGYSRPIYGVFDTEGFLELTAPTREEALQRASSYGYPESAVQEVPGMTQGVPNAPFKATDEWAMLAFKRMLRWAAENGYDRIAWTTGDQQAERYGIPGHGMRVFYDQILPKEIGRYIKKWGGKVGRTMIDYLDPTQQLYHYRGPKYNRTQLERALEAFEKRGNTYVSPLTGKATTSPIERVVNAQGLRRILREMVAGWPFNEAVERVGADLPAGFVREILGGQLIRLPATRVDKVHAVDITPAMREAALSGQPMFARGEIPRELSQQELAAARDFLEGEPVARMKGDEVPRFQRMRELIDWTTEHWRRTTGGVVTRSDLGDVRLSRQSVRDTIAHGLGPAKQQALYLVPEILAKGRLLGRLEKSNPTKPDAFLIAAPVSIGPNDYYGLAVVRRDANGSQMYVHEVVLRGRKTPAGVQSAAAADGSQLGSARAGAIATLLRRVLSVNAPPSSPEQARQGRDATSEKPGSDAGLLDSEEPMFARVAQAERSGSYLVRLLGEGQPIDRAFRAVFEALRIPAATRWAYHQLERLVLERRFNDDGFMGWANPLLEHVRAGLIDRYGLSEEYKVRDLQREIEERRIKLKGKEFVEALLARGVDGAEARVLQAVLTGEVIDASDWAKVAEPIRAAIDELGQEAVMLGLISQEAYERNRGRYLHRVYLKHETQQDAVGRWIAKTLASRRKKLIGSELKRRGLDLVVSQEALTAAWPKDWWGERKERGRADVSLIGRKVHIFDRLEPVGDGTEAMDGIGDRQPVRRRILERVYWPVDVEVPARFQSWEDKGFWEVRDVRGDRVTLWRDYTKEERERMGEILDARYTIAKTFQLLAHDLATARFYRDIAQNPEWAHDPKDGTPDGKVIHAREGRSIYAGADWVLVPETTIPQSGAKRWGALAGKYVRAEIWRDINELDRMHAGSTWRSILTQWKLNKTARNPVVHVNNVMSNLIFMDMADVRFRDLIAAIRAMAEKSSEYQDAVEHGVFGTSLVDQELRSSVMQSVLAELHAQNQADHGTFEQKVGSLGRILDRLVSAARQADAKMLEVYELEDNVFRMAMYMRRLAEGDTKEQAARMARDQFLNYDVRAPWVNTLRTTVLPFIAYTYRAVPVLAKSIAERPWKLAKYVVIAQAVQALSYALAPGDEDEERRSMRDEVQGLTWIGVPRMLRMPWRDQNGDPVFLDIRRWIPAGDVFDMNQGQSALPIPAPLQFGGPLMLAMEFALNKQAFTGREITDDRTDDTGDKVKKVAGWAWRSWMPAAPWIPESWYWQKIERAIAGGRDELGRDYTIPAAVLSSLGIKFVGHDVRYGFELHRRELNARQRALEFEMRQLEEDRRRNLIPAEEYLRQREAIKEKMRNLQQRAREIFQGSE